MSSKIDTFINEALSAFTNRQIIVTDRWGNKVKEYESVTEMLQERFDEFMSGRVDDKGNTLKEGCSYNDRDSRIQYIVDKVAKRSIDKFTKNVTVIIDRKLKTLLKDELQENLSNTVFKSIDVQKLLRGF